MRDALADVVKQSIGLIDIIKITGKSDETRIQGVDEKKTLFVEAYLKEPIEEFEGAFGLTNLALLRGLLDFSAYRTDQATFAVKRRVMTDDRETVEQLEFRDGRGAGADFRCMSPDRVPEQAEIQGVRWDVSVVTNKLKVAEFQQLASLYAEVDKSFGVKTENGNLLFFFGDESSSTHRASMVFEEGVAGTLNAGLLWSAAQLLQVLKLAGPEPRLHITGRGVLAVEVETEHGSYKYYLRASR